MGKNGREICRHDPLTSRRQTWPDYDEAVAGGRRSRDRRSGKRQSARPVKRRDLTRMRRIEKSRAGAAENCGNCIAGKEIRESRGCSEQACQHRHQLAI